MSLGTRVLRRRVGICLALSLATSALVACGQDAPAPAVTSPEGQTTGARAPDPEPPADEPSGPSATGASFALVSSGAESYTAGELGQFAIELTGRGGWHVNMEYPTVVQLEGDGVTFPSARLEREQAAEFAEARVRFDVPFTPAAAGDKQVRARVQFAMCNPSNCVPEERTLTLALAVQ